MKAGDVNLTDEGRERSLLHLFIKDAIFNCWGIITPSGNKSWPDISVDQNIWHETEPAFIPNKLPTNIISQLGSMQFIFQPSRANPFALYVFQLGIWSHLNKREMYFINQYRSLSDWVFSNPAMAKCCTRLHPHRLRQCRAFVFFRLWRKNPSHQLCRWSVTPQSPFSSAKLNILLFIQGFVLCTAHPKIFEA